MKSETKKELIIRKSRELFMRKGISRVTVKEIADNCGISKKTIYSYFDGKDELTYEAIKEFLETVDDKIEDIKNNDTLDFFGKIKEWLKFAKVNLFKMRQEFLEDIQKKHSDLWDMIEKTRKKNINDLLYIIIKQGQKEGLVRKNVNIEFFISLFYRNIVILTDSEFVYKSGLSLKILINNFIDLFLNGILIDRKKITID